MLADALLQAVGIAQGSTLPDKMVARAETMLGQLLLGNLAEQAFEHIYRTGGAHRWREWPISPSR